MDFIGYLSRENAQDLKSSYGSSANYLDALTKLRADFEAKNVSDQPLRYEPFTVTIPGAEGDLSSMRTAACDSNGHLHRWLQQSPAARRLAAAMPDWVGISVSFMGQLPAAFAIANYCRHQLKTSVIFGGPLFNDFAAYLNLAAPVWKDVNGVILGAGESLVSRMIRLPDGRIAPSNHRQDFPGNRWLAKNPSETGPPVPDFSRFPLDRYRAPGRVLPFRAFSSCSWGRCTFCADAKYRCHTATADGKVGSITQQVMRLVKEYTAQGIYFLDAELPGKFLLEFAEKLNTVGDSPPRWGGNARFSSLLSKPATAEALFASGCRLLRFGLESGSPRILKRMAKGITPNLASKVLKVLHQAGIATHVYLMKGFPGETETDWQATRAFLYEHADCIDMFNISTFQVYADSPLAETLGADVETTADENHWTYPLIHGYSQDLIADAQLFSQIERDFFTRKPFTRCFSNTADTLLLAERFSLSFF
ncbi:MAG: radical SAM protein [Pseudomonadota bacterium]